MSDALEPRPSARQRARDALEKLTLILLSPLFAVMLVAGLLSVIFLIAPWALVRLVWRALTDWLVEPLSRWRWRRALEGQADEARWALERERTRADAQALLRRVEADRQAAPWARRSALYAVGGAFALCTLGAALVAMVIGVQEQMVWAEIGWRMALAGGQIGGLVAAATALAACALLLIMACETRVTARDARALVRRVRELEELSGGLTIIDEDTEQRLRGALSADSAPRGALEEASHDR